MSSLTTRLRLLLQSAGTNTGTWGDVANQVFSNIDDSIAGVAAYTVAGGTVTMSASTINATDEARCAFITVAGTLTSAQTIVAPQTAKTYVIINATTGAFTVSLSTLLGTPIVIPQNTACKVGVSPINSFPQFYAPPINLTTGKIDLSALSNIPLASLDAATQALINGKVTKTGDAMTGPLTISTVGAPLAATSTDGAGSGVSGLVTGNGTGSGAVGIISGTGSGSGVLGSITAAGTGHGVLGQITAAGTGNGVLGQVTGAGAGHGVLGQITATGNGHGVYGLVSGTGTGRGCFGEVTGANASHAVQGRVGSACNGHGTYGLINGNGGGTAAVGITTGSGSGHGVFGQVSGAGGGNGVYGYVNGSGTGHAVQGSALGTGGGNAGYFVGNVVATGTITPSDRRLKSDILPLAPIASKFGALPLFSYVKHRNGVEVDYLVAPIVDGKRAELQALTASLATLEGVHLEAAQADIAALTAEIKKWDDEDWLPIQEKAYPGRDYGPMAQDVQAIAPELVEVGPHDILQIKTMAVAFALIDDLRTQLAALKGEFAAYKAARP